MHAYLSVGNNLLITPYDVVTTKNFIKRGKSKIEMKSQPRHPWCKKICGQESKKWPC